MEEEDFFFLRKIKHLNENAVSKTSIFFFFDFGKTM